MHKNSNSIEVTTTISSCYHESEIDQWFPNHELHFTLKDFLHIFFFQRIHSALILAKAMDGRTIRGFRSILTCQTCFTFSLVKLDLVGRTLGPDNMTAFQTQSMIQGKLKELLT